MMRSGTYYYYVYYIALENGKRTNAIVFSRLPHDVRETRSATQPGSGKWVGHNLFVEYYYRSLYIIFSGVKLFVLNVKFKRRITFVGPLSTLLHACYPYTNYCRIFTRIIVV